MGGLADSRAPQHFLADEPPFPPRYRWARRLGLLLAVAVAALVGVRMWWGREATRRVEARLAAYAAAGEPIDADDFVRAEPLADEDNAALGLSEAAVLLALNQSTAGQVFEVHTDADFADEFPEFARIALNVHCEALETYDRALECSAADWGLTLGTPVWATAMPHLAGQRALANLVRTDALLAHADGRSDDVLRRVNQLLTQAEHLATDPAFVITHLVAVIGEAWAYDTIERSSATLALGEPGSTSRRSAAGLISRLLEEQSVVQRMRRAMQMERLSNLDAARECLTGFPETYFSLVGASPTALTSWIATAVTPMHALDALRSLDDADAAIQAAEQPDYPAARRKIRAYSADLSGWPQRLARGLSRTLYSDWTNATRIRAFALFRRRAAATALAIRLYEIDYGERPLALDELVPQYLPAVPRDPFSATGEPVRYLPWEYPARLYSVSDNGRDDGGVEAPRREDRATLGDERFLLDPDPELQPLPKSLQAYSDQDDPESDRRY